VTVKLKRVRLELARTAEYPEGSSAHGYEFIAPLSGDGHIDPEAWNKFKQRCRVRHFVGDESEHGVLRHVGRGWRFDYDGRSTDDDEPFFKLDRHALTPGAYVSITEHDGIQRPFKVVSVTPA
jgi:hypothetical protein